MKKILYMSNTGVGLGIFFFFFSISFFFPLCFLTKPVCPSISKAGGLNFSQAKTFRSRNR
jgi:hypothetical protein